MACRMHLALGIGPVGRQLGPDLLVAIVTSTRRSHKRSIILTGVSCASPATGLAEHAELSQLTEEARAY
jgi:hypothetical protein